MELERWAPVAATIVLGMGSGGLLRASGRLSPAGLEGLRSAVLDVTLPALAMAVLPTQPLDGRMAGIVAVGVATIAALGFALEWFGRRRGWDGPSHAAATVCGTYSNTVFVGLPVVQAVWGATPGALATAFLIDGGATIALLWTVGEPQAARLGGKGGNAGGGAWSWTRRPAAWGALIGFGMALTGLRWPGWFQGPLEGLGRCTGPLAFVVLGAQLQRGERAVAREPLGIAVAARLLIAPALTFLLLRTIGAEGVPAQVAVVEVGMPTALAAAMLAGRHGDGSLGSAIALGTLIGAVVTLPAWIEVVARAFPA